MSPQGRRCARRTNCCRALACRGTSTPRPSAPAARRSACWPRRSASTALRHRTRAGTHAGRARTGPRGGAGGRRRRIWRGDATWLRIPATARRRRALDSSEFPSGDLAVEIGRDGDNDVDIKINPAETDDNIEITIVGESDEDDFSDDSEELMDDISDLGEESDNEPKEEKEDAGAGSGGGDKTEEPTEITSHTERQYRENEKKLFAENAKESLLVQYQANLKEPVVELGRESPTKQIEEQIQ